MNFVGLYTLIRREVERTFRIIIQTLGAPLISAFLFIFIFGFILGRRIELIAGVPYILFVFPGVLMMNMLSSSFDTISHTLFVGRWIRSINEVLVAPLSYLEMVIGYVVSAITRGLLIGLGVLAIGLLFGAVSIAHSFLFIFYAVGVTTIFALLGILAGLWAKGFKQLGIFNIFIIMPLSFLGGMFYSVEFLPETLHAVTAYNPMFYFIDGMRYAALSYHESNLAVGAVLIIGLIFILGTLVFYLFKKGWRLRN